VKEKREIPGTWWIFGSDKEPCFGMLRFDPASGLELNLNIPKNRTESELALSAVGGFDAPKTIWGLDEDGKPVTLFGCFCTDQHKTANLEQLLISPLQALIGGHFSDWRTTTFSTVDVEYSLLHNWLGRRTVQQTFQDARTLLTLVTLADIVFQPTPGVTAAFRHLLRMESNMKDFKISEWHVLEFTFAIPATLSSIMNDFVQVFRRLLTLFVGKPVFLEKVVFLSDSGSGESEVELLRTNRDGISAERDLLGPLMRVPYGEIATSFPEIASKWFLYHTRLDSVLNLYFSTIFSPELSTNNEFLFLAQALEVYHNYNPEFSGFVQTKEEFKRRREAILEKVPEGERDWLKEKLNFANTKTLAQRLRDLLAAHLSEVPLLVKDSEKFAQNVRDTRNYYTHFNEELKEKGRVSCGEELIHLTWRVRAILEICILKDLGISGAPIQRVIQEAQGIQYRSL
jgi:hypothetical protein